ncbi:MAG: glycosyltransferase family 4 protein [Flavobacteriales bacterium]|jgi:glycosyltransferase involved in cell wall biosynthesis|nr:glycosyltransferase family 4 protein [Flavobacteriales bacterium]
MPRILFIASHRPGRSPNQRFRFEQFIGHLEQNGYETEVSFLISEDDDRILYEKGNLAGKAGFVRRSIAKRRADLARANEYDIIFVSREALMTRSTWFERAFRRSQAKVVYDFDDSIWLDNVSDANRRWKWVKNAGKTAKLIGLADLVLAGNAYLADYARRYNGHVTVMPTTIDTEEYLPRTTRSDGPVVIGWSGSITTIRHFRHAVPALLQLKEKYGDRITFRVVGDGSFRHEELGIQGLPWNKVAELDDLRAMDIGIMPLPDDDWARGKCGLKGLQYMALGIPSLMSPVGVNCDIIQHGINGFLPSNDAEWVADISRLVEDAELRSSIGQAGRNTVVEQYSLRAWQQRYVGFFNELIEQRKK